MLANIHYSAYYNTEDIEITQLLFKVNKMDKEVVVHGARVIV